MHTQGMMKITSGIFPFTIGTIVVNISYPCGDRTYCILCYIEQYYTIKTKIDYFKLSIMHDNIYMC